MDRRAYLKKVTTVAAAGLAGCVAPNAETETPGGGETPTGAGTTTTETPADETETPTDEGTPTGEETPTDGELPSTVQMVTEGSEYYFDPVGLLVERGETITWRIESGAHSSTAYHPDNDDDASRIPEGAEPWDSGILSEQGATFDYTFEVGGTYDYYCTPHKTLGMVGRVVVESPGGPAENSPIPNGNVPDSETIVERGAVSWGEFTG